MARKSRKKNKNVIINTTIENSAEQAVTDGMEYNAAVSARKLENSAGQVITEGIEFDKSASNRNDTNAADEKWMPTAVYARLSMEDNGRDTSDSIDTQVSLAEEFIRRQKNLIHIHTFIDNGYTGTDFDRPQFKAMMEKVKTGDIRCIVVKDLSRFGRNYVELGYYIENIFPLLGIRLIAVNDNFDSFRKSDRDSLSVPIKNMVNAAYAKDVSKKQGSVMETKKKLGIHRMAFPPYGYQFDEQRNLVRDPETAPYVRMIFSWAIAGIKRSVIAKRLHYMGIPTPLAVLHGKGMMMEKEDNGWTSSTVRGILGNPAYAGTLVLGKTKRSLYDGIKLTSIEREGWTYFYDRHEQIVSKIDYQAIEARIEENRQRRKAQRAKNEIRKIGMEDCFRGMAYCAECGKPMHFERRSHQNGFTKDSACLYYRCTTNKKEAPCENKRVSQNFLKIIVMDQIRTIMDATVDKNSLREKMIRKEKPDCRIRYYKRLIRTKRIDVHRLRDKVALLYADYSEGTLGEEDYQLLKERITARVEALEEDVRQTKNRLLEIEMDLNNNIQRAEALEAYMDSPGYDETMVKEMVERIDIHNGNRITVKLKCADMVENWLVKECLESQIAI